MMKPIFNSLGGQYSRDYVWVSMKALVFRNSQENNREAVQEQLSSLVPDMNVVMTGKGREAITLALLSLGLKPGDGVLTQAFACVAVEHGIVGAGCVPVYVDITEGSTNLGVEPLERAFGRHPQVKALIVQHVLGMPAKMEAIWNLATTHNIKVIEDWAHYIPQGENSGKSDAIITSFGRDKLVDAVTGGAVWTKKSVATINVAQFSGVPWRLRWYPLLTYWVRLCYRWPVWGKLMHGLFRKLGWLTLAIGEPSSEPKGFPEEMTPLLHHSLVYLDESRQHRKKISAIYAANLKKNLELPDAVIGSAKAIFLRYPILAANRNELMKMLTRQGVYVEDVWYRKPVDTGSVKARVEYEAGSCPVSERLAEVVVNLPTHLGVSVKDAKRIAMMVNEYAEAV